MELLFNGCIIGGWYIINLKKVIGLESRGKKWKFLDMVLVIMGKENIG